MSDPLDSCLYVAPNLGAVTTVSEPGLAKTTERHHIDVRLGPLATCLDPLAELAGRPQLLGAIIGMDRGWPGSSHIRFAASVLKAGRRAWFYWPAEQALECIDKEALGTYWRLWAFCTADLVTRRLKGLVRPQLRDAGADVVERGSMALRELYASVKPVSLSVPQPPTPEHRIAGTGTYLRADYWVQLASGASDEHTASVATALAGVTDKFTCLMASRVPLLDDLKVEQVVMPAPQGAVGEIALLDATWHYYPILAVAFAFRRPAYIYERLCPGNFAAALVSRDLGIPYIVEYNGSGLSTSGSFNGISLEHAQMFERAEEAAFRQATIISVPSDAIKDSLIARKIDAAKVVVSRDVDGLWRFIQESDRLRPHRTEAARVSTADAYKEQVQDQWNFNPVGTHYATRTEPHSLQWFQEIEAYRYGTYAPWMASVMEFDAHAGHDVLEIGGGVGTDLSQFAKHGARVTDLDLSAGHLALAQENFERRGLQGRFVHHDAEDLPFADNSFDLVYSNGVLHHTPNTTSVVREIRRVLRPGGRAIVMMYAEHSIHYWRELVGRLGLDRDLLRNHSIGEIMSRYVEVSQNDARPLVKVYTARKLKKVFDGFDQMSVSKRQLLATEVPGWLSWLPVATAERLIGWNIIIKARKPVS